MHNIFSNFTFNNYFYPLADDLVKIPIYFTKNLSSRCLYGFHSPLPVNYFISTFQCCFPAEKVNVSLDGLIFVRFTRRPSNRQSRTVSCSVCSTSSRRRTLLILSKWPSNQLTQISILGHETDVPFTSHLFHSRNTFIYLKFATH